MLNIERTNSSNPNFIRLVKLLDADLAIRDGEDHAFYDQFNKIDNLQYVVVCYEADTAVGCGAIKPYNPRTMEIKRMFTLPDQRGKGIASKLLSELEKWALELGYTECVLETGIKQHEAIGLYHKNNYQRIPNYGQYANVDTSQCFSKKL